MLERDRPSTRSWAAITTESTSSMSRPASSRARRTVWKISSVRFRAGSGGPISTARPSTKHAGINAGSPELREHPVPHEPQGSHDVIMRHVPELGGDDDLVVPDAPVRGAPLRDMLTHAWPSS